MKKYVRRRDGIVQRYEFRGRGTVKEFRINDHLVAKAQSQDTSSGFRHIAVLYEDGVAIAEAKATYQNRTWEAFEFQSVLEDLLSRTDALSEEEKRAFLERGEAQEKKRVENQFRTMGNVAALGNVFARTPEERVAWKLRMIKAGTGDQISLPDDWEQLSLEEKERRLDAIIKMTQGGN